MASVQREPLQVVVKRYALADVEANPKAFNVNNLGERPADYEEVLGRGQTREWVGMFHQPQGFRSIKIDSKELEWMREAAEIGKQTGRASPLFAEEMDALCDAHEGTFQLHLADLGLLSTGAFIRTEEVSLKYGQHGAGPYWSFRKVLESMLSSIHGHLCVPRQGGPPLVVYVLPWLADLSRDCELRVFVHNNHITAASQQTWQSVNPTLGGMSDEQLAQDLVLPLVEYFEREVRDKLPFMKGDCVLDITWRPQHPQQRFYFIEPNSFGGSYASGSSLFHWETDHEALHSLSPLQLRIVDREE